jgi:hypothetical protein
VSDGSSLGSWLAVELLALGYHYLEILCNGGGPILHFISRFRPHPFPHDSQKGPREVAIVNIQICTLFAGRGPSYQQKVVYKLVDVLFRHHVGSPFQFPAFLSRGIGYTVIDSSSISVPVVHIVSSHEENNIKIFGNYEVRSHGRRISVF